MEETKAPRSELQMEALRLLHGTPENTAAHYFHSQFCHSALHIFKDLGAPSGHPELHRLASRDADERADGGERVAAMIPGARHQRGGVQTLAEEARVPVHGLLHDDGHRRRDEGKHARHGLRAAPLDAAEGLVADQQARDGQYDGEHDGRAGADDDAANLGLPPGLLGGGVAGYGLGCGLTTSGSSVLLVGA